MKTITAIRGIGPCSGRPAGGKAWLLVSAAALALGGCSLSSGIESAAGAPEENTRPVAQTASAPAPVSRSQLAPRPTMSEPGVAWPAAVEWVQAQREAADETPSARLAAEPNSAPLTWEQGMAEPATWTEPGEGAQAQASGDDVLQLAAVPVESEALSEERGGFVTSLGRINIGFDLQTFVNGQLQVRNIFNMVGDIAEKVQNDAGLGQGLTVRFDKGAVNVNPPSNNNNNSNTASNTNTDTITDTTTDLPDTTTATDTANTEVNTPPPAPPANVVISEIADGHIRVVNELNGGDTKIINEIANGGAHTTVINTADGIDIEHISNLVIDFVDPSNIVSVARSGFKTNGDLTGLGNGMRSALIGAISQ